MGSKVIEYIQIRLRKAKNTLCHVGLYIVYKLF
jgi:hypothetical protein